MAQQQSISPSTTHVAATLKVTNCLCVPKTSSGDDFGFARYAAQPNQAEVALGPE
jgi:hypothetical protein